MCQGCVYGRALQIGIVSALLAIHPCRTANAGVTVYTGGTGWTSWQQAAGGFTTLDFTDLTEGQLVAPDRYASSGMILTDLDPNVGMTNPLYFLQDQRGLEGFCHLEFTFTSPMKAVSLHFPGLIQMWLYAGDRQIAFVNNGGAAGANNFKGFTSDLAFDRLRISRLNWPPPEPCDEVEIDNLYFSSVPSPGALAALAMTGGLHRRRRRSN